MRPTASGLVVAGATALGTAAVILLNPSSAPPPGPAPAGGPAPGAAPAVAPAPVCPPASPAGPGESGQAHLADGTYLGDVYQAPSGPMQVQATITGGTITEITWVLLPDNPRSMSINSTAAPALVTEALAAQSADVASVSGATYTTAGFRHSLQSALARAVV